MSVAGHFWSYTQLSADGEPAPFLTGYTGTSAAIEALTAGGPATWVERLADRHSPARSANGEHRSRPLRVAVRSGAR
jgi:hypothetical protein